jgi:hypothetical protein
VGNDESNLCQIGGCHGRAWTRAWIQLTRKGCDDSPDHVWTASSHTSVHQNLLQSQTKIFSPRFPFFFLCIFPSLCFILFCDDGFFETFSAFRVFRNGRRLIEQWDDSSHSSANGQIRSFPALLYLEYLFKSY